MKRSRILGAVLALCLLAAGLSGCHKEEAAVDGETLFESLLEQVSFQSELEAVGEDSTLFFTGLPEDSQVRLYMGNGSFADEAALITLPSPSDSRTGLAAVEQHLADLRSQYQNYIPEEVVKLDNAVVYAEGKYIILCVTADSVTAEQLLKAPSDGEEPDRSAEEPEPEQPEEQGEPLSPEPPEQAYPPLTSRSGVFHDYGNSTIRVDDRAYEKYSFSEEKARSYAQLVSRAADELAGQVRVYSLPVPNAAGIVLPDDIVEQLPGTAGQGGDLDALLDMMSENVIPVRCYDNLMRHRDEELYFGTDYHWNGPGAYYGYEAFCEAKGVEPWGMDRREEVRFPGFLGILYQNNSGEDPILAENPDTVIAYRPVSPGVTMRYTDKNGESHDWDVIRDVSNYSSGTKYMTFAAGDNPIAVFHNPGVTDGSVCVLVKDSFGNALLSYLVDHYSTVYELDPRYWTGNLMNFAREKQAVDLIIENNIIGIGSSYTLGKLSGVING